MKQYPVRLKIILLCFCTIIACTGAFISYSIKEQHMTTWQKQQQIDFDKQTGATKFKAIIDSTICGALLFTISAISTTSVYKFYKTKKK